MTELVRVDDWPSQLHNEIENWQQTAFAWGEHDCAHFVSAVILAITGTDIKPRFEHWYSDEASAAKVIEKYSGMRSAVSEVLGLPIPCISARRGDIVAVKAPQGFALGVVVGVDAVALTTEGLRPFAVGFWQHCWKIG